MTRVRTRVRPPVALALPALLAVAFLLLPLVGILSRTQWAELTTHLTSPDVVQALELSLVVSFWALGLSLVLGVPLAWLLARVEFKGKAFVRSLVLLPMVLPPTVGGVALLLGFGGAASSGPGWRRPSASRCPSTPPAPSSPPPSSRCPSWSSVWRGRSAD